MPPEPVILDWVNRGMALATAEQQLEDDLACRPAQVLAVAGIGVSLATCGSHPNATWKGLLAHGLGRCAEFGTAAGRLVSYRGLLDNETATADDLINVASFITAELSNMRRPGLFAGWLLDAIGAIEVRDPRLVRALDGLGVNLATTNYDHMIEDVTGKTHVTWRARPLAARFFREPMPEVMHLHGSYREHESVVLGARSYAEVCRDEYLQNALRAVLTTGTVVFVGCGGGLDDPNFGTLMVWARSALRDSPYSHFIVVRDREVAGWQAPQDGLPLLPVGYGPEYADLAPFLERLGERVRRRRQPRPLDALITSQSDYESRWADLEAIREQLPPEQFFRRARELTHALWAAGGRRRAAVGFSGLVLHRAAGLSAEDQFEFSLDAAGWLLDDDLPDMAGDHLDRASRLAADGVIPPAQAGRLRRLQVRCFGDQCDYDRLLRVIEEELRAAGPADRDRLEAERAELRLLQGDLDGLLRDWEG